MVMRIGGLASGMDTEQIVQDLMRAERMKMNKLFRNEENIRWKREALNTTNKTLADFILKARSNFGLTRTTSTGILLRNSTNSFDWVKKVSSSNESVIKATASATAMEGTYNIEVRQLAEVASVMSEDLNEDILDTNKFKEAYYGSFTIETANNKKTTIKIKDAEYQGKEIDLSKLNFSEDDPFALTINGKLINFTEDIEDLETYLEDFKKELEDIGVNLSIDDGKLTFTSKNDIVIYSSDNKRLEEVFGLKNGLYEANNTINDVVKQINNAVDEDGKSLGLRAAYDFNLGKLMITSKEQGKDQYIYIDEDVDGVAENIFGKDNAIFKIDEDGEKGTRGKNAQFWFNESNPSDENIVEQSSNNFTMFGVDYQLQSVGTTTINVESDVDGIFGKVQEFVDNYNELIDELNGLLSEKVYRDFQPLTNEEKEAMKEKEIELWEEKAKSGLLRNDETISRMLQTMRSGLYMNVEGLEGGFNHITQIGITTGNYQSGGKLEINEEKLKQAIIDNPDGVIDLLFKTSDIEVPSGNTEAARKAADEKRANSGLVERLFNDMIGSMKDIVRRAGAGEDANTFRNVQSNMLIDFVASGSISKLDKDLMNLGKRIAREEMILAKREERYWNQFTAMEKALEKMNQQSGWLMTQLGQMG